MTHPARVPDRYHTTRESGLAAGVEERNLYHPDPDDPASGLAPERTELAWDRSGLAVVVCAAVLGRRLWPFDSTWKLFALAMLGVGIALWLAVLIFTTHRARPVAVDVGAGFRRMTVATVAFAVGGFVIALLPPPTW